MIRFLLTILIIYLIWRVLFRYILPYLLVKRMGNFQKKNVKKEGQVTINHKPKTKKSFGEDDGEYVDFEEVE